MSLPLSAFQMPVPINQQQHQQGQLYNDYNNQMSSGGLPRTQFSHNFWENYEHLCALQSTAPLQAIHSCICMDGSVNISLNADKLK
jgi:hypothetical protein